MNQSLAILAGLGLLAASFQASALMQAAGNPPGPAVGTMELPDMEVRDRKRELALRLIKSGLDAPRSTKHEHRDRMYCWFDKATGSRLTYLYCASNRALNAESRLWQGLFTDGSVAAGTLRDRRHIYRSRFPVNRGEVNEALARLGPSDVNEEIVNQAMHGAPLPENLPDTAEFDGFVAALAQVRRIRAETGAALAGKSPDERRAIVERGDRSMAAAIREAGLSVRRYNQISDLVERFESLRDRVRTRQSSR